MNNFNSTVFSDANFTHVTDQQFLGFVVTVQVVSGSFLRDCFNVEVFVHPVSTFGVDEEFVGKTMRVHEEHVAFEIFGFDRRAGCLLGGLSAPVLFLAGLLTLALWNVIAEVVHSLVVLAGLAALRTVHFCHKENFVALFIHIESSTVFIEFDIFKRTGHLVGDAKSTVSINV